MYLLAGLTGMAFLLVPVGVVMPAVILFVLAQALIVADFFVIDTYVPEVFSTDFRNFVFGLLDSISKVKKRFEIVTKPCSHFSRQVIDMN